MVRQEYAPLTDNEIAYVNSNPVERLKQYHEQALAGSRLACYTLSLEYYSTDTSRAYLWATVALLAGEREAAGWMRTMDSVVPRENRFYLETVARKWYTLHKGDFEAQKSAHLNSIKSARAMGWTSLPGPENW